MKSDINGHPLQHDPKYLNMRIGMNSRLDTLQAAILIEKLAVFAEEIELRQDVAQRYDEGLSGHVLPTPRVIEGGVSIWAQYVIEHHDRDGLAAHLKTLRRADRRLLSGADAPPDALRLLPRRPRRPAGLRSQGRARAGPADARLPDRGRAGPDHRGVRGYNGSAEAEAA